MKQTDETFELFQAAVVSCLAIVESNPQLPDALIISGYTTNVFSEDHIWASQDKNGKSHCEHIEINFEWVPEHEHTDIYPFLLKMAISTAMPAGLFGELTLKFDASDRALQQKKKFIHIRKMLQVHFDAALRNGSANEGEYQDLMLEDKAPLFAELVVLLIHDIFAAESA